MALSQLGNVGPELGQSYIVDSFLVVVLGGVGKLVGCVVAAFGLGILTSSSSPRGGRARQDRGLDAVVLVIQKRPQGPVRSARTRTGGHVTVSPAAASKGASSRERSSRGWWAGDDASSPFEARETRVGGRRRRGHCLFAGVVVPLLNLRRPPSRAPCTLPSTSSP